MLNQNDTLDELNVADANTTSVGKVVGAASSTEGRLTIRRALRKVFSFQAFLAALLIAGAYVGTFTNVHQALSASALHLRWVESDTLWHIAVGNLILKTHTWPVHDIYSFTAHGTPWIAYEWLGEVLMAVAWQAGGMHGLAILLMLLVSSIILGLFYYSYLGSRNAKSAFAASTVLLPLAAISWTMRPQLLGYAFLIITLILLKRFREGHKKGIWALPLIFLLWTNSHGTFVLGYGVLGIYWLSGLKELHLGDIYSRRWTPGERQRLELIALLGLIASIITPYGTQMAAYPLEMAGSQPMIIQIIQEWQPLSMTDLYGKLFLVLVLAFWTLVTIQRKKIRLEDAALLVFATAETFMHARFMVLFVPVIAPVLAELITPWFPPYSEAKDRPILNFVLVALIIAWMVKMFPSNFKLQQQIASEMPVKAVQYMDSHPGLGPTFNYFFWGGYLILNRAPAHKVFIDGRLDIYEYTGVFADYMAIISVQPNVNFLLRKYHVRSCLIPPNSSLATLLVTTPGWKRVYDDGLAALFVREKPQLNAVDDIQRPEQQFDQGVRKAANSRS